MQLCTSHHDFLARVYRRAASEASSQAPSDQESHVEQPAQQSKGGGGAPLWFAVQCPLRSLPASDASEASATNTSPPTKLAANAGDKHSKPQKPSRGEVEGRTAKRQKLREVVTDM